MVNYQIPSLKIDIGNHPSYEGVDGVPEIDLSKYDVVFNVSDSPEIEDIVDTKRKVHWLPINEFGYWGYPTFYWLVHLMDNAVDRDLNIYLHCVAGMHRSPILGYLYLRSLDNDPQAAFLKVKDQHYILGSADYNWLEETLQNDIEYGRIPEDVIDFMKDVRKHKTSTLMNVMKLRNNMDFPQKTIDKQGIKKPVGQQQVDDKNNGKFNK